MSMTHDEMIAVIQAGKEGAALQVRSSWDPHTKQWQDRGSPGALTGFNFEDYEYRIKPTPSKPREWWLNVYDNGVAIHSSEESARTARAGLGRVGTDAEGVHVREVLPEEEGSK